jgi:ABC-2 type transport system permease protein
VFTLALRLRTASTVSAAVGMAAVIVFVGALFPSVGDAIGRLDVPAGVAELLGGADYSTITGWMRSEIGAVYGPLVVSAIAITAAAALAGDEEDGILALELAHPMLRARLVLARAGAVAAGVVIVTLGTFVGLVAGTAVAGGGIATAHVLGFALHLAAFGLGVGALALALAATTGRRAVAVGGATAVTVLGFLVNGLAPFVHGLGWTRHVSPFSYYAGHDPLAHGADAGDLAVLVGVALVLTAVAAVALGRRDLRS